MLLHLVCEVLHGNVSGISSPRETDCSVTVLLGLQQQDQSRTRGNLCASRVCRDSCAVRGRGRAVWTDDVICQNVLELSSSAVATVLLLQTGSIAIGRVIAATPTQIRSVGVYPCRADCLWTVGGAISSFLIHVPSQAHVQRAAGLRSAVQCRAHARESAASLSSARIYFSTRNQVMVTGVDGGSPRVPGGCGYRH